MKIERAIEILDPEHRENYDGMDEVNEACRMGMEALERTRWISCSERMPEKGMQLLLYVPKTEKARQSGIFTGELKEVKANNGSGNFWNRPTPGSDWTLWGWSYFEKPNVTHWMPLPEPPEEVLP